MLKLATAVCKATASVVFVYAIIAAHVMVYKYGEEHLGKDMGTMILVTLWFIVVVTPIFYSWPNEED